MSKPGNKERRLAVEQLHLKRIAEVRDRVKAIGEGSTRADVERLLPTRSGGLQGPHVTQYYEEPEILIEVRYDDRGGAWSPENRVREPPRVLRGRGVMD